MVLTAFRLAGEGWLLLDGLGGRDSILAGEKEHCFQAPTRVLDAVTLTSICSLGAMQTKEDVE